MGTSEALPTMSLVLRQSPFLALICSWEATPSPLTKAHKCLQCYRPPDALCHHMAGQGRSKLWLLAQQTESWAAEYQAHSRRPRVFKQLLEICYMVFYFQQGKNYTLLIFFLLSCWQCDTRESTSAVPDSCQVRSGEDLVQTHAVTGNGMSWFTYLVIPDSFPAPFITSFS